MNILLIYTLAFIILALGAFYFLVFRSVLAKNKRFDCIRCEKCCGLIVNLSDKDISRINSEKDFVVNVMGKKYMKMKKGRCIFFELKDGKSFCNIHSMRPDVCRKYPKIKMFGMEGQDAMCKGLK